MTVALVPDVERLVSDYLRAHAEIIALNTRIVGKTPDTKAQSWVRVTVINDPAINYPDHLIESMTQFDCYAGEPGSAMGGQPGANLLKRTIRHVLSDLPGDHPLGVVSGVQILGGPRQLETSIEPARDVAILVALIFNHA